MKKLLIPLFFFLFGFLGGDVRAQSISNINIGPTNLDISRFSPYYVTAEISDYGSTAAPRIEISTINGDVGNTNWNFFSDGSGAFEILNFPMVYDSGDIWRKTNIYPDYIYPEIFFAPSLITWNNTPLNTIIQRNSYQLLHFQNPFTMTGEMSFWIEFNAVARAANSADLQVYLVSNSLDFFNDDWRNNSQVELVGNIAVGTSVHHTHTENSAHYLISLSTNSDKTVGNKHLDVSGDFWIILYNTSPNNNRGWNLRYQSICTNASGRWLRGSQSGWTTTTQTGCPDAHVHIARRSSTGGIRDGVKFEITAAEASESATFYFNEIPNLPPNATNFLSPVIGSGYSGSFEIGWDPAADVNGDELSYNIFLQNSATGTTVLQSGTTATSFSFDSTSYDDGNYTLLGEVCDGVNPCVDFNLGDTFTINNSSQIFSLEEITIFSNNIGVSEAVTGDRVTLNFVASGTGLSYPQVDFYINGEPVDNQISLEGIGTSSFSAFFTVDEGDDNGRVTFTIDDQNLDQRYYETTDASFVSINNPTPTSTPIPTSTPTPTLVSILTPTPASILDQTPTSSCVSSSVAAAPFCNDAKPLSASDLFQIDISGNRAKLFFTPISNTNKFYVSFSENKNGEQHGEEVDLAREGVQSHTVYFLKSNTTYYFKVRGQNGCMPGEWSQILKARTLSKNVLFFNSVYKNGALKTPIIERINREISLKDNDQVLLTPTLKILPTEKQEKEIEIVKKEIKRRCFLWWCWEVK